ncbi:MAG: hypothetical protein WD557_00735 [Dehalococcoidia bacterium]
MLFAIIFLSLFLVGWLVCAFLPWLAVSVATRGNAGLGMLPMCLFTGVVAALAVPLLVNDGWTGVWLSFVAAIVAPAVLMAVRRFAASAALTPRPPLPTSRERGSVDPPPAKPAEGRE